MAKEFQVDSKTFLFEHLFGYGPLLKISEKCKGKSYALVLGSQELLWLTAELQDFMFKKGGNNWAKIFRGASSLLVVRLSQNNFGRFIVLEVVGQVHRGRKLIFPEGRSASGWWHLVLHVTASVERAPIQLEKYGYVRVHSLHDNHQSSSVSAMEAPESFREKGFHGFGFSQSKKKDHGEYKKALLNHEGAFKRKKNSGFPYSAMDDRSKVDDDGWNRCVSKGGLFLGNDYSHLMRSERSKAYVSSFSDGQPKNTAKKRSQVNPFHKMGKPAGVVRPMLKVGPALPSSVFDRIGSASGSRVSLKNRFEVLGLPNGIRKSVFDRLGYDGGQRSFNDPYLSFRARERCGPRRFFNSDIGCSRPLFFRNRGPVKKAQVGGKAYQGRHENSFKSHVDLSTHRNRWPVFNSLKPQGSFISKNRSFLPPPPLQPLVSSNGGRRPTHHNNCHGSRKFEGGAQRKSSGSLLPESTKKVICVWVPKRRGGEGENNKASHIFVSDQAVEMDKAIVPMPATESFHPQASLREELLGPDDSAAHQVVSADEVRPKSDERGSKKEARSSGELSVKLFCGDKGKKPFTRVAFVRDIEGALTDDDYSSLSLSEYEDDELFFESLRRSVIEPSDPLDEDGSALRNMFMEKRHLEILDGNEAGNHSLNPTEGGSSG